MTNSPAVAGRSRGDRSAARRTVPVRAAASRRWRRWTPVILLCLFISVYIYVVLRTAWISDDAYISFRSIVNFIHGYGLTHNVGERVQSFTHPLWALLLSGICRLTHDIYYTSLIVSMVFSISAVVICSLRIARSRLQATVGVMIFIFSKAFVDYSTSGLENPLTYLLLAVFLALYLADTSMTLRRMLVLSLIASLCVLNRMDTLLLCGPVLLHAFWTHRHRACGMDSRSANVQVPAVRAQPAEPDPHDVRTGFWPSALTVAAGFLPFVAWEIFSVIYYGFPFPNTAYAKLNTGIPALEYAAQGLRYLKSCLRDDPLTLCVIGLALVLAGLRRDRKQLAIAAGVALYLAYTIKIGGDFMSGRFLTAPLLAAVVLLVSIPYHSVAAVTAYVFGAGTVALLGFSAPFPNLLSDRSYGENHVVVDKYGIADERAFFYTWTGLLRTCKNGTRSTPDHFWIQEATARRIIGTREILEDGYLGLYSCFIGPDVYVTDVFALSDPLLARIPMIHNPHWRIGHFMRFEPDGYQESTACRGNKLTDPDLRLFYDTICLITRGPLFTRQRWAAIIGMNLGLYDHLIHKDYYRFPPVRRYASSLDAARPEGARLDASRLYLLPDNGMIILFSNTRHLSRIEISLDGNHDHRLVYLHDDGSSTEQILPARGDAAGTLTIYSVAVPQAVARKGFERLHVLPMKVKDHCSLGHVRGIEETPSASMPTTQP